jgi:hypothetical protein
VAHTTSGDDRRPLDFDQAAIGELELGDDRVGEEGKRHERRLAGHAFPAQERRQFVERDDDGLGLRL